MQLTFDNVFGSGKLHLDVLKSICGETGGKSIIDLCTCHAAITPRLGFEKRCYVDIQKRKLDYPEEQKYFVQYNALDYFAHKGGFYDVAIALDAIEHFKKQAGLELLRIMQENSHKQIIFTPLGDYCVEVDDPHPDSHSSGWLPHEFEEMGWATIVFPRYHETLNFGAFYAFNCHNLEQEFERISNELKNRVWIKSLA